MATSIPDLRAICVVVAVLALAMCAGEPPGTPPAAGGDDGEQAVSAAQPAESQAAAPAAGPSSDVLPLEGGVDMPAARPADCPDLPTAAAAPPGAEPPPTEPPAGAAFRCAVWLPDGLYDLTLGSAGSGTTSLAIEIEGGALVLELAPRQAEPLIATSVAVR